MSYTLPDLPYGYKALEPFIDETTMMIHHTKHHAAYISNLNKAVEGGEFAAWPVEKLLVELETLPEAVRTAVRNNGGGHANHSLFWRTLAPDAGGEPSGKLKDAVADAFGGFTEFKEKLSSAAMTRFGSGWAWLVLHANKGLGVYSTVNQDSPLTAGDIPLLGIDVWEHAYYLKYQNRRAEYIEAFFKAANWKEVEKNYEAALSGRTY